MSSLALVRQDFSPDQLDLIRKMLAPKVSGDEFRMFIEVCKQTGLNPIARQIYAIVRYDKQTQGNKMTIQTSIDGLRLLAQRTGNYAGQCGPWWCGKDGEWKDVWLDNAAPAAAKVGVMCSNFKEPLYAVAKFSSYIQTNKEGRLSNLWEKMPEVMIAKVAEALALRRAFPAELSGLYTTEEMMQADNPVVVSEVVGEVVQEVPVKPPQAIHPASEELVSSDEQNALFERAKAAGAVVSGPGSGAAFLAFLAKELGRPIDRSSKLTKDEAYRIDLAIAAKKQQSAA